MSEAVRYLCAARLDGTERFFLWESGDSAPDRVVLDGKGFILAFSSEAEARAAPSVAQRMLSPEAVAIYDFDRIRAWCESNAEPHDCSELLNVWNLFNDVPNVGDLFGRAEARETQIYDKLFRGCNLPAMTPPGEHYTPVWSASETAALKRLLLLGLAEFRTRLR